MVMPADALLGVLLPLPLFLLLWCSMGELLLPRLRDIGWGGK
jgi:hypothetical protein